MHKKLNNCQKEKCRYSTNEQTGNYLKRKKIINHNGNIFNWELKLELKDIPLVHYPFLKAICSMGFGNRWKERGWIHEITWSGY